MIFDIIGAGIGGLTTAIALQKKGIETQIFEQAREIRPVGAGIVLANNAMQVYEKLGLKYEIEEAGNRITSMHLTNAQLQPVSTMDLEYFELKYQVQTIAIHRGRLQQVLLAQIDSETIHSDHELTTIKRRNEAHELIFANGAAYNSERLIGADGLDSRVRDFLFPKSQIRNAYQVCWRGVTEFTLPKKYQNELNEAWGQGDRFGFVQIAPGQVYWFALRPFNQTADEHSIDGLNDYFHPFHPMIKEIIKATPIESIHTSVISDLKPIKKWHEQNVCLIGDAAHATTPNLGQGACQAIEDAYILSECLHKYELKKALTEYQRLRMPKAHQVVNTSWTLGKIAHWKNPLAVQFRNTLMKSIPKSISRKQSERVFHLETV